jgi:hypothetical protein
VAITINSNPSTSTIFGNATPNCNATGQIYSVTNSTGSNYAWSVPSGAVITSGATGPNNSSITVDFSNSNGNISVIETDINGCVGTQQDLAIALVGCGCLVNIPDALFKNALVTNLAINTNADTEIQCTEASAFNGTINVDGLGINDLSGIEAFTSLSQLFCNNNNLTTIDVSANTALTRFQCVNNQLTAIDVSSNILFFLNKHKIPYLCFFGPLLKHIKNLPVLFVIKLHSPDLSNTRVDDIDKKFKLYVLISILFFSFKLSKIALLLIKNI